MNRIEEIKKKYEPSEQETSDATFHMELGDYLYLLTALEEREGKIEELNIILSPSNPMKYTMYKKLIARADKAEARVAELEATQEYATDACMTCKQKYEAHLTTAREALEKAQRMAESYAHHNNISEYLKQALEKIKSK